MTAAREELAEKIAGEIVVSENPGATLRKWREDFDISQMTLSDELDISASVISDYEGGRRDSPGISMIRRIVHALLDIDERRGGDRIRQYARIVSAGFEGDVVLDIREYRMPITISDFYAAIGAEELQAGDRDRINGHTVIDSIAAIKTLSSDEFYHLYGQSTSRALIFTNVSRGESPLVALRVVNPTPNAVILHGLDRDQLWEHANPMAAMGGYSLAICNADLNNVLSSIADLGSGV
ncbi:MAG: helix-turn-helix domain-containing protein [Halobacteriaceae archaeon]